MSNLIKSISNFFHKPVYHTEEKEIRNSREIEKYIYHGSEHYRVVYVTTYHIIEYMDNNIIKEYDIDRKYNGKVYFSCEEEAELYAKHTTGPEYKLNDDHMVLKLNNANALSEYGYFCVITYSDDSHWLKYDDIEFCFKKQYNNVYGYAINISHDIIQLLNKVERENFDYINYVIQNSHINDNVKETIKSFDVVTLEPLPINVVKECSEELEQLNKILKEFYQKQEEYTTLLKKITEK